MEELLNRLGEILNNETILYSQILNIGNKKTDIIIKGRVNELAALVEQEQDIVLKLSKVELDRDEITSAIHKQLGLNDKELTLTQLISHIDGSHKASLLEEQKELSDILKQVRKVNDQNGKLIKNSLEFIEFSINVLSSATNPGNNYNQVGYSESDRKSSMFDMKL